VLASERVCVSERYSVRQRARERDALDQAHARRVCVFVSERERELASKIGSESEIESKRARNQEKGREGVCGLVELGLELDPNPQP